MHSLKNFILELYQSDAMRGLHKMSFITSIWVLKEKYAKLFLGSKTVNISKSDRISPIPAEDRSVWLQFVITF